MSSASINVLVTRPEHQAGTLVELLKQQGLKPIRCPSIAILAPDAPNVAIDKLKQLNTFDYLVFISANAVKQADLLLRQQWPKTTASIIAIGPKTKSALEDIGLSVSLTATTPFTSEQLISSFSKQFNISNNARGLIIKGQGGRDYLQNALNDLDITIETADVYQRALPEKSLTLLPNKLSYITITSQLALNNLFLLYPNEINRLKSNSTFVVLSERIANYAKNLGCKKVCIADQATDEGLLSALLAYTHK